MSKARAKVFPKPPERLNSTSAKLLGKNSNKACYEASVKGIYNTLMGIGIFKHQFARITRCCTDIDEENFIFPNRFSMAFIK